MDHVSFLQEIMATLGCNAQRAEGIAFVVLQELRERLQPRDAADVAAQLPRPLQQLWLEDGREGRPISWRYAAEFVGRVRYRAVLASGAEAECAVRAVFGALQHLLESPGDEAWAVRGELPNDLTALWRGASDAHGGVPAASR